jgi:hypothetical protein
MHTRTGSERGFSTGKLSDGDEAPIIAEAPAAVTETRRIG